MSRLSLLSFAATCAVALLAPRTLAQEGGSKGDAKVDFVKQVKPLLEQRCFNCHGGKRTEGELDMTSKASLFHDDEVMWSVVPGDHAMSPVYERVALPAGDPDLMPEDGPPLSAEQIAVLKRWIDEGADWPEGVTLKGEAPPPVDVIEVPAMDDATGLVIAAALESLRERGAVAQTIAVDTQAVDVNLSILGDKAGDDQVLALANLGPALAWLNLSRTAVTDKGMAVLTRLPHLRRLHLAQTAVGDGGLVHAAELKALQYLNLYGSKVTDAGLVHLHGLSDLRKLYL